MPRIERPVKFTVRFTQNESLNLAKLSASHGIDQAEFIRRVIFQKSLPVKIAEVPQLNKVVYAELTRIKTELSRWGNNLNQIARIANTRGVPVGVQNAISNLAERLDEIRDDVHQLQNQTLKNDR